MGLNPVKVYWPPAYYMYLKVLSTKTFLWKEESIIISRKQYVSEIIIYTKLSIKALTHNSLRWWEKQGCRIPQFANIWASQESSLEPPPVDPILSSSGHHQTIRWTDQFLLSLNFSLSSSISFPLLYFGFLNLFPRISRWVLLLFLYPSKTNRSSYRINHYVWFQDLWMKSICKTGNS